MEGGCPVCGAPRDWREMIERRPWEYGADREGWTRYSAFNAGTVRAAVADGATYEKRRPVRAAKVESDVQVPVLQSVITGVVGGVLVGAGAGLLDQGWRSILWGMTGGAVAWGVSWLVLLNTTRSLLWEVERIVGGVARPSSKEKNGVQQRDPITVETVEKNARGHTRRMLYDQFPINITDDDLTRVAQAVLEDGNAFSRRGLGDVVSGDKFKLISDTMLGAGMAEFRNRKNASSGLEITGSGRSFLRQFAEQKVVVAGGGRLTGVADQQELGAVGEGGDGGR